MISNNGNGTSQDTSQIPDGYLTNYYSGQNETGTPQGSGSTTFDGSGNSVTMRYSGLNRTGASGGTTVTLQDGAGDYTTLGLLATNINFGATRVNGGSGSSPYFDDQLSYLSDSGAGAYPEGQLVIATDASGPYTVQTSYTGETFGETYPISTGAPSDGDFDVTENTGTAGQFSATILVGVSAMFNTMQNGQPVGTTSTTNVSFTLSGNVYATAVAQVSENGAALTNNAVTFTGHVGDQISQQFTLANIATGALTDSLSMALATQYASIFDITGLPRNVASGGSANFTVTLNTSQAGGYYTYGAYVNFNSHDSQQADTQAVATTIPTFSATITNYAVGQVTLAYGSGAALSGSGTSYVLNLGNITKGSTAQAVTLSLFNATTYYADNLGGSISVGGANASSFTNSGTGSFSNIGGGQQAAQPTISLSTTATGDFTETLTISLTDTSSYGYSGTLPTITVRVYGSITPTVGGPTKTFNLSGGTNTTTGTSGYNNVANFTTGSATPNGQWVISENTAGTVVLNGVAAGYNGTATLNGIQQVDLNGTTYNLDDTTLSGEAMTVGNTGAAIAVDGPGTDDINFDNNGETYWHAASGTTTALLQAGTTELYMTGAESQYTIAWSGASALTLTDKVANRNNVKTIDLVGGNGDIVFADGSLIGLDQTNTGDSVVYTGAESASFSGAAGQTIYTGQGSDTIVTSGNETVIGGSGLTTVYLSSTDTMPDNLWAASENAAGQVVINGTKAGYNGTVTLSNVGQINIGIYDYTYSLTTTPTAGGVTNVTTDGLVVDGAGNDTLNFEAGGYWHAGGGSDTANLYSAGTEIYMLGVQSQYTISYNSINTVTVTDSVANRNGTKTINLDGGYGDIVFADGSEIGLDSTGDPVVYGGLYGTSFSGVANEKIYTGEDTTFVSAAPGDTIVGGSGETTVFVSTINYTPDQTLQFSENAARQTIFNGMNSGFAGNVTMSNVGQIDIGPYASTYNLVTTPVAGGTTTLTAGAIIVDGAGNDTLSINGAGSYYWYAGGGNDTAILQSGTATSIFMTGAESQYTITYDGVDNVTITDTVSGRNGIKTFDLFGGEGEVIFASGPSIALGGSTNQNGDAIGYGGSGTNVFIATQGTTSFSGSSESYYNAVQFNAGNSTPNASWAFSENAQGNVIVNGTAAGFSGTATLSDIQAVGLNGTTYALVSTPLTGETQTMSAPLTGLSGTIIVEGSGHNNLTIDNYELTYWHVSGANDIANLQYGTTELYMTGTEAQYNFTSGSTLDVIDTVANRNGTLAVTSSGDLGQVVFSDGKLVWLGNDTFALSGGTTTSTGTGSSGNVVNFTKGDATPDGAWVVSETSGGAVTIAGGTGSAYSGTATLNDIQQVAMGAALYDLATAPVGGGSLTISTPTDLSSGTLVVDSTGNDTLSFNSNDISYWHAGAGNDTATISSGTTDIYFLGSSAQYTFAYSGLQVIVTDSQSARNGVKTINLSGGSTTLMFADTSIALSDTGATETGEGGNDTFTLAASAIATINGGSGTDTVIFSSSTVAPTGAWSITENTSGQVVVHGTSVGYTGTATLTSIEQLTMAGHTYALVTTPNAGGSTTIATPGTGISGTIVADGSGADALTFSGTGTSYWHVGTGNNTATLSAGTTEIYFTGASSQYTETFSGTNVLTVKNTATNATETLTLSGGSGELVFASGSSIGLNKSGDTTIYGGSTAATLTGTTGADTIYAGSGAETLIGAGGVDTYKIGAGATKETIQNGVSSSNTAAGNLDFTGSIDAANLWFMHSGNNLVVDVLGTTRQTVMQNWFATGDTYAQTSEIISVDSLKLDTELNNLITAMATFSTSNATFNPQTTMDTTLTNNTFYGTLSATDKSSWHS